MTTVVALRELTFVEEELGPPWAGELKALLREMHAAVDQARVAGATQREPTMRDRLVTRYAALLAAGVAQTPQPPPAVPSPRRRGRRKQSPARNLPDRHWTHAHEALCFLY